MALKLKPIKEIMTKELEKRNSNNVINISKMNENNINKVEEPIVVNKIIFLLFAEFLGYVSDFVKYADEICEGKEVPKVIYKIMELDADYIFRKMQEEYTLEEIKGWYNEFYPLLLKDYEESLKEKKETTNI